MVTISNLKKLFVFLIGFSSISNFVINPESNYSVRLTDLLSVFSLTIFLALVFSKKLKNHGYFNWILVASAFFTAWIIIGIVIFDLRTSLLSARFTLYILTGFIITTFCLENFDLTFNFIKGLVLGALCLSLISLGQLFEWNDFFLNLKPSSARIWWTIGQQRVTGMYEHPNGLSHIATAGALASFSIFYFKNKISYLFYYFIVVGSIFFATATRGGLLISMLIPLYLVINGGKKNVKIVAVLGLILIVSVMLFVPSFHVSERWVGDVGEVSIEDNFQERLYTQVESLFLSTISPFGMGVENREELLMRTFGFIATHNSYISFSLTYGVFAFFSLVLLLKRIATKVTIKKNIYLYCIAIPLSSVALSFLFEDSIYAPSNIMILTVTCCLIIGLSRKLSITHKTLGLDKS